MTRQSIISFLLLPLMLTVGYLVAASSRIGTQELNTDELIYIRRSMMLEHYLGGNFAREIWDSWDSYDQPQLTNFVYALALVDKANEAGGYSALLADAGLTEDANPCQAESEQYYAKWGCLDGQHPTYLKGVSPLAYSLLMRTRTVAVLMGLGLVLSVYATVAVLARPIYGLVAGMFLILNTLVGSLMVMAMIDPLLLLWQYLAVLVMTVMVVRRQASWKQVMMVGVLAGLAMSSKLNGGVVLGLAGAGLLLARMAHDGRSRLFHLGEILVRWLVVVMIAGGVFVSINPFVWLDPVGRSMEMLSLRQSAAEQQQLAHPEWRVDGWRNKYETVVIGIFTQHDKLQLHFGLGVTKWWFELVLVMLGVMLVVDGKRRRLHGWVLIVALGNMVAVMAYIPLSWDRYLLPAIPGLVILLGYGLWLLEGAVRQVLTGLKLHSGVKLRIYMNVQDLGGYGLGKQSFSLVTTDLKQAFVWGYEHIFKRVRLVIVLAGVGAVMGVELITLELFLVVLSVALLVHGSLTAYGMLYSFSNPERLEALKPALPRSGEPLHTFTLLLPARDEVAVIGDTLRSMAAMDYPAHKYEVLVMVRVDDVETWKAAEQVIAQLRARNIRLIPVDGEANTKSFNLNLGLHYASGEIVAVFDAEDEPNSSLLRRINATFNTHTEIGVIQSAVQLINVNSSWFSGINCVEYYFWFKSVLPFLTKLGVTPLGGNTVFFRREVLGPVGAWDEHCLTEDADIGIRLSAQGVKMMSVYEEELATLEESPVNELGLIKQRSRWDQGFLQVLTKGNWRMLALKQQRWIAMYVLLQPMFRHIAALNFIVLPLLMISGMVKVSVFVALFSLLPGFLVLVQIGLYLMGLVDLGTFYGIRVHRMSYVKMVLFYFPFQVMLSLATFRAIVRLMFGLNKWDKTAHYNLHRPALATDQLRLAS